MELAIILANFLVFLSLLLLFSTRKRTFSKRLPPGSLGMPIIGQTFQILKAMRDNRFEEWLQERSRKYGPIWKVNVFGSPTVFLQGQEANKFVYSSDETVLSSKQPASIRMILGERNISELVGQEHKRIRGAILSFLNPEALKRHISKMDEEIKLHLKEHWLHNQEILVMPLMRTLTFNVICTILFGIERGGRRDELLCLFKHVISGSTALPINLPFTSYNRSMRAVSKVRRIIMELISEKREKLDIPDHPDLITSMLSMRDEANSHLLSDEEIVDNCIFLMQSGYDSTSMLLTFLIKHLAENQHVYETVLNEQEEIARGKAPGYLLSWGDLRKMKYTWRVAMEALRIHTLVTMSFRKVLKDIEMGGYIIPKGWAVASSGCTTHLNESIFPDPYKLDPSRHENKVAIPPYTYVAFGGGPRICPGYDLAKTETLSMIHYLVTGFKWKLALKENIMVRDPMPVFKQGLPIHIEIKKPRHTAL